MSIVGRITRRIAFRAARGIYRKRGVIALGAVLIAAFVVASSFSVIPRDFLVATSPSEPGQSVYAGSGGDGEPQATLNYLRGQQLYDASLVWETYSDGLRRRLTQRGTSMEEVQRRLEATKQRGPRIEQVNYIGSLPIPNGKMAVYIVAQSQGGRGNVNYIPYAFTLDASGKIDAVE